MVEVYAVGSVSVGGGSSWLLPVLVGGFEGGPRGGAGEVGIGKLMMMICCW